MKSKRLLALMLGGLSITLLSCSLLNKNSSSSDNSKTPSTVNTSTNDVTPSTTVTPTSSVTPSTTSTTSSTTEGEISLISTDGYAEGLYAEFKSLNNKKAKDFNIKYKKHSSDTYKSLDKELIRDLSNGNIRFDVVGIKADKYDYLIQIGDKVIIQKENIAVSAHDRSGYAHFNVTQGVGAYNNDGTLKDNAVIVYVTDETKNTVTANINNKTYTGLSNIIKASKDVNQPIDVRIVGKITAATWNPLTVSKYSAATTTTVKGANNKYLALQNYDENQIISGGFNTLNTTNATKLNGLTNKIKYDSSKKEFDSYYNMLDVSNAKNITVEGIGTDAEIFQWGFTWKSSKSVEIRNLTFTDYTEDACSFESGDSDSDLTTLNAFNYTNIWLHNNTFNKGINYWDVCSEQDKHDGDGATDFKRVAYVTISYNHYIKNHKTGLVGGGDSQMTASLTFHHNYYDECQSRLPFARQANMHMYNNYYYKSTGNNMQIYANAYAFIENCYFENVKKTFIFNTNGTPAVKSFNNVFISCGSYNVAGVTTVTSRTEAVTNSNIFGQTFDINSNIFYYDSVNKKSNVEYMTTAEKAKEDCKKYSGAGAKSSPLLSE